MSESARRFAFLPLLAFFLRSLLVRCTIRRRDWQASTILRLQGRRDIFIFGLRVAGALAIFVFRRSLLVLHRR
jgi:hypothetical protein